MNANNHPDPTLGEGRHHGTLVARLRRAWDEGRAPSLEAFIGSIPDVAPQELATLIRGDFEARWDRAERRNAEEYLNRFADVASHTESAVDVIYAEYLAREKAGQQPHLAE